MVETTNATTRLQDARLTPVQWDTLMEGVRLLVLDLPSHHRAGGAALAVELDQVRQRVGWLG